MDREMRNNPRATEPDRRAAARRSAADRDRGLLRIAQLNRWLIGGAIAMTGFLTTVAALAHPGSSHRNAQTSSSGSATQNSGTGSAGASTDPNTAAPVDPNSWYSDQSAVPADPSQVPAGPSSAPQAVPDTGVPPAATSGGS